MSGNAQPGGCSLDGSSFRSYFLPFLDQSSSLQRRFPFDTILLCSRDIAVKLPYHQNFHVFGLPMFFGDGRQISN